MKDAEHYYAVDYGMPAGGRQEQRSQENQATELRIRREQGVRSLLTVETRYSHPGL